jgi:U3 small nucleolar RNA-associated protein 21
VDAGVLEVSHIQELYGFRDRITALQLSSDCRWLLSASLDGTIRVWDVPAGKCLQVSLVLAPMGYIT